MTPPSETRSRGHLFRNAEAATSVEYAVLLGVLIAVAAAGAIVLGTYALSGISSSGGSLPSGSSGGGGSSAAGGGSGGGSAGTGQGNTVPVFTDNFADPRKSNARWKFSGSSWQLADGTLQAGPVGGWNRMTAYAKNSDFGDGSASVSFTLESGAGVGIFFHLSDNPINGSFDGYSFEYAPGYGKGAFVLHKWAGGVEIQTPLAVAAAPPGYQWYNVPRTATVTTQGAQITASVDGVVVLSTSDKSYPRGGVGLTLWNNPAATFTTVSVTKSEAGDD